MLLNARLNKGFQVEVVTYACHLINQLPLAVIGGKTLFEVWFRKTANDYGSFPVFGSTAYYHVKKSKLDLKAKKILFKGISFGVKGYRLWCSNSKKIIFSRDVTIDKSVMLKKVTHSNSEDQKKTSGVQQQVESTTKQVEFVKIISKPIIIDNPMADKDVEEDEVLTQKSISNKN